MTLCPCSLTGFFSNTTLGHNSGGRRRQDPGGVQVIKDLCDALIDYAEAHHAIWLPGVCALTKDDNDRFTIDFPSDELPGPGPPLVVPEIWGVGQTPGVDIGQ